VGIRLSRGQGILDSQQPAISIGSMYMLLEFVWLGDPSHAGSVPASRGRVRFGEFSPLAATFGVAKNFEEMLMDPDRNQILNHIRVDGNMAPWRILTPTGSSSRLSVKDSHW